MSLLQSWKSPPRILCVFLIALLALGSHRQTCLAEEIECRFSEILTTNQTSCSPCGISMNGVDMTYEGCIGTSKCSDNDFVYCVIDYQAKCYFKCLRVGTVFKTEEAKSFELNIGIERNDTPVFEVLRVENLVLNGVESFHVSSYSDKREFKLSEDASLQDTTITDLSMKNLQLVFESGSDTLAKGVLPKTTRVLRLEGCNLESIPADIGSSEYNIEEMYLSENAIIFPKADSSEFEGLKKVKKLDLSYNKLQSLPIGQLINLEYLNIAGNPFATLPRVIFKLENLKHLNIRGIEVKSLSLEEIAFLNRLDSLNATFLTDCESKQTITTADDQSFNVCVTDDTSTPAVSVKPKSGPSTSTGNSTTLIIVLSTVAAVGIIFLVVLKLRKRRLRDKFTKSSFSQDNLEFNNFTEMSSSDNEDPKDPYCEDVDLQYYRIPFDCISLHRVVRKGMTGIVWLGEFEGTSVAVKHLIPERANSIGAKGFKEEIRVMTRLRHRHIVDFIGMAWSSMTNIVAVSEFMKYGTLRDLLSNSEIQLSWKKERMIMCLDITEALVYMHTSKPVVRHLGLRSGNIMMDSELRCKLSVFAISRSHNVSDAARYGMEAIPWLAPEIPLGEKCTDKVDVFALGIILGEIKSRKVPYSTVQHVNDLEVDATEQLLQDIIHKNIRPKLGKKYPSTLVELIEDCTLPQPELRPTSEQVLHRLRMEVAVELDTSVPE